jgi:phage protein D
MISLPSFPRTPQAAVRRPIVEVDLGGSADDWAKALLSATVDLGTAPGVDAVELRASPVDGKPDPAVGDEGTISLGFEDGGVELVFTGRVEVVARDVRGSLRVVAANAGSMLAGLRMNSSFEQQTAGDVVKALVDAAGASAGTVAASAALPFYVVDDRRSGWRHIADLARDCDCLAYVTPDGKVTVAAAPSGPPVATFAYGQDILDVAAGPRTPAAGAITVLGDGAAGGQGSEAWSWLVKDPASVKGTAGGGSPERLLSAPWLRSQGAAQGAADGAAAAAAAGAVAGRVLVVGSSAVAVGTQIAISGAPQDALDGSYVVHGVRHRFAPGSGFTTLVRFGGAGGGGIGGLP